MRILSGILAAVLVASCGGGGKKPKVARVDADTQTDLSGNWNDTDAKMTSEALIKQCLGAAWLTKFKGEKNRAPIVRVRKIVNKTDEHIDAQVFVKNIERAMVNSGEVEVVAQEGAELSSAADEKNYATSGAVSDETDISVGQAAGADYLLVGRLASVLDQVKGERAKLYKITFELIDTNSEKKVWMGDHEIKKVVTQARAGW